ncbi:MFS general substrate transporter [Dissoconium aciculare CBS 342.82]|uniref:MFS general substrate transporter n=1 Tax=Dissoconium aciculare CBS 342.82 TaxID=1314786 RepID=A0A6J3LPQ9_9PEZI|nr:MFS general substrate transporter [Dissoconium aciculare CBS 342.82]KAF1817855.1 MFS general substrate transporter [Dissoconium aciculare CBS 342.82]
MASSDPPAQPQEALSTVRRSLLYTALGLAVFCQALDNTIIATAIPRITDEFQSLNDVGWWVYGAGYLVACCALQLSFGKLYNLFPTKWVFLSSLGVFELGSLVCAVTPSSIGLIMGRVIAGAGSGGIFAGAILTIAATTPLAQRSIYNGMLGAIYALASIVGPLMGGAFTALVTWRLCFYINLPIGFFTAICVFIFLDTKVGHKPEFDLRLGEKLKQFDLLGMAAFIPFIVCLLLALQWGGSTFPWSDGRIIALLVLAGVLLIAFAVIEIRQGDKATVPPSVARNRTVWSSALYMFLLFGSYIAIIYYLPIWLQAILALSPVQSGIDLLPLILPTVVFAIIAGGLVAWTGYYTWTCILSSILATAGAALLSTLQPSTSMPRWIGYQILYGVGAGLGLQQPLVAIQTALPEARISEGTAILVFMQNFGGAVVLAIAQSIFNNTLVRNVRAQNVPVDANLLLTQGATRLTSNVPAEYLPQIRQAYNDSIDQTFYVALATAALSLAGSAAMPWLSVKHKKSEPEPAAAKDSGDEEKRVPSTSKSLD